MGELIVSYRLEAEIRITNKQMDACRYTPPHYHFDDFER